jgi:two-component system, chemotaxis family, protein-glutamate methylesterase/glutaminase
MNKIKVLIVDDSAVVRQTLEQVLSSDHEIEIVGSAPDPYAAAKKMKTLVPDVITLDVEMPRMDGITFLKRIMSQHPIPVVICSSLTGKGSETAMKALEYGAVEIIHKPQMGTKQFLEESNILLCDAVKAAAQTKKGRTLKKTTIIEPMKKLSADAVLSKASKTAMVQTTEKIVVVGASTGGTEALRVFLEALPYNCPGVVVVQHMPENFTTAFAGRLNDVCQVTVKEATNNDSVIPGHVLIAPGNKHTLLKRSGARYFVEVKDGPLVSRHRPSVDVLFRSASKYAGKNVCGVIMTGMGDDGAKGMAEMKEAGSVNIAQNEATCVVFGMPNEAIKAGGVDHVLPLQAIAGKVIQLS